MIRFSVRMEVKSNRFPELAKRLPALAGVAVRKAALDIEAGGRMRAPVDTGYLRGSIQAAPLTSLSWLVRVGATYGVFVEFGHRAGRSGYVPARPYFIPAVEVVRPQFRSAIANALKGLA